MSTIKPIPFKNASAGIATRIFWLASLLFFVSGGTGLAYQVIWFKRFSHVWGSSSLAFAAVGGSFLFGLGLGAWLIGHFADRVAFPLRWYGRCELLIGALALVIPLEITALVDASAGLYVAIPEQPLLRYAVQFCITLMVIGPPCALMGGTLPLLVRQLTSRNGSLDQATGWLYGMNSFGAALGCYLTGFHLLAWFGLLWTNSLAASVNLAIGLVAILVSRTADHRAPGRAPSAPATAAPIWSWTVSRLYVAAALSGSSALALEMIWTRQLALVLGGSTYAYTATLFVVLLGIASGSLLFHFLRRMASSPLLCIAVIGLLVVSTMAGRLALPWLSLAVAPADVRMLRAGQLGNAAVCVAASSVLEFLPALAMGVLFPLLVHLTHASAARVGATVGNIYAWNTLGSIAGASLTAVLVFPRIGTAGATALTLGLYVVALLLIMPWRGARQLSLAGAVAVVGAGIVAIVARPIDPRLTNMGFYLYGTGVTTRVGTKPGLTWESTIEPLYFREGASSNVLVTREGAGELSLRVNGKVDASNVTDMVTQLGLAYFPRIFKHDARDVLVIGFGSGCTSGRSLLFPGTRVTCCEIEPAVYAASETFASVNGRPQEMSRSWLEARNAVLPPSERLAPEEIDAKARFVMIFGDGRTAIQGSPQKYDLIISEPSNPWLAGVSNLFTKEFFHAASGAPCRRRRVGSMDRNV